MIFSINRMPILWTGLWLAVLAGALFSRPLMPIDETRYLSVAWEMWTKGDFLVPHLNGEIYSHKPPMLFWLINLGWGIFGVNEWWPRLIAPIFGLASLFLCERLARELWPGSSSSWISSMAPMLLFGGLFWTVFTTLTMFDTILTAFSLVGLIGVVRAWSKRNCLGFILIGVGIGFGLLTKGPAILLHILPVALLAPIWGTHLSGNPTSLGLTQWYLGILATVIIGSIVGLAWAIPASLVGGEDYRDAIFWGQSAGRIVSSFAHSRSWWWYLAVLPVFLLPWVLWPTAWRAIWKTSRVSFFKDGGVLFCLSWFTPALIAFSIISGKQFHYLLPELPSLSLVFAKLLSVEKLEKQVSPLDLVLPGLLALVTSVALFLLPILPLPQQPQSWWNLIVPGWGLLLALAGIVLMATSRLSLAARVNFLAVMSTVFVISIHLAMRPVFFTVFDLKPLSIKLAQWQREGVPLAHFSKYHGQYNFLGRLTKPIIQVGMFSPDTKVFVENFPNGKIIAYHDNLNKPILPSITYRFRTRLIAIWDASEVAQYPGITERK